MPTFVTDQSFVTLDSFSLVRQRLDLNGRRASSKLRSVKPIVCWTLNTSRNKSVQSNLATGRTAGRRTPTFAVIRIYFTRHSGECFRPQWALSRQTLRKTPIQRPVTTERRMLPFKVRLPI